MKNVARCDRINTTKGGSKMAVSKAQMKATQKYMGKTYYRPCVMLRREYEDALRKKAEEKGMTVSSYIVELIKKDLNLDIEKDS